MLAWGNDLLHEPDTIEMIRYPCYYFFSAAGKGKPTQR